MDGDATDAFGPVVDESVGGKDWAGVRAKWPKRRRRLPADGGADGDDHRRMDENEYPIGHGEHGHLGMRKHWLPKGDH